MNSIGDCQRDPGENDQCCTQPNKMFYWLDIFCSEFHQSKDEIEALLFHPGYFFLRRLNKIAKSSQQKVFFFLDRTENCSQASDPRSLAAECNCASCRGLCSPVMRWFGYRNRGWSITCSATDRAANQLFSTSCLFVVVLIPEAEVAVSRWLGLRKNFIQEQGFDVKRVMLMS